MLKNLKRASAIMLSLVRLLPWWGIRGNSLPDLICILKYAKTMFRVTRRSISQSNFSVSCLKYQKHWHAVIISNFFPLKSAVSADPAMYSMFITSERRRASLIWFSDMSQPVHFAP